MNIHPFILTTILIISICLPATASTVVQQNDTVRTDTLRRGNGIDRTLELEEVVVTSFRYNKNVRNISAPFQVVGKARLESNDIGEIAVTLNSVPGIQMQSGTFQTTKVTIRGIGSRSPYSTNRTRAFMDDIPLTTGDGNTVIDDIELTFIDKIEITKGPHSAWYGSGMGGSVRFVSLMQPATPFTAAANVHAGSFGLGKVSANVRTSGPQGYLNAGVARIWGDGYRQNSAFGRSSAFVSGQAGKQHILNYLLMLSDVKSQTPSSVNEETYRNAPHRAAPNWLNVKGHKDYQRVLAGLRLQSPVGIGFTNIATISGSIYDQYELRPFNILDDKAVSVNLQENIRYSRGWLTAAAGLEWLHEDYSWQIFQNNTLAEQQNSAEKRNQVNAYLTAEATLHEAFILSLTGNVNSTRYTVTDLFAADSIDYSGRYSNKLIFSPKLGLTYRHNADLSLFASAGHGFSNPTVEESLSSEGFLNPNLRPEQGLTVDLGARGNTPGNTLSAEVSAYYIRLTDLLVTKRITEAIFYGENAGKSTLKGIELQVQYRPAARLRATASANASDNRFVEFISDGADFTGRQLPGIPRLHATADLHASVLENLWFQATYTFTGGQYMDDANSRQADTWQTINLRADYSLKAGTRLRVHFIASVQNLFNERYASMILINAPSFGGNAPRYYYPALTRNFLFTVKLQFN